MHDPLVVSRREAVGDLERNVDRLARGEGPGFQQASQALALEELHHGVVDAVGVSEVIHGEDVGMRERGERLRLPLEPGAKALVLGEPLRKNLHRDPPTELRVERHVNLAHSPGSQGRQDFVGAQSASRVESHRRDRGF